jgi:valyl-tRNA synthetase
VLGEIRRAKTEAKVSQKAVVQSVTITATAAQIAVLEQAWPDIADAGSVTAWTASADENATEIAVSVILEPAAE